MSELPKLSGYRRFQLVRLHRQRYSEFDREQWIKSVCKAKGLEYTPPIDITKSRNITTSARMFPAKKQ